MIEMIHDRDAVTVLGTAAVGTGTTAGTAAGAVVVESTMLSHDDLAILRFRVCSDSFLCFRCGSQI